MMKVVVLGIECKKERRSKMFFSTKKAEQQSILNTRFPHVKIEVTDEEVMSQLRLIELTEDDLHVLNTVKPYIEENIQEIVDAFYSAIGSMEMFRKMIDTYSSLDRLRQTLRRHVLQMFDGVIDENYIAVRTRVSLAHVKIGLLPKWYLVGCQNIEQAIRNIISSQNLNSSDICKIVSSVGKICNFEQQLVLESYERIAREKVEEQQEEVKQNVREVIGGIAKDLDIQSSETNDDVHHLIQHTNTLNQLLESTIQDANETKEASKEGQMELELLSSQNRKISDKTVEMTEMVQKLDQSSSEIQAVVAIVKDIADQTNLLSLNSAIEAARAGEYGKGFAVVANEVRKLAEQTKTSVEQISKLISMSGSVTEQVIEAIHQVQELVKKGIEQNEKSLLSFNKISSSVDMTIKDFQDVGTEVVEVTEIVKKLGDSSQKLEEASSVLQETILTF